MRPNSVTPRLLKRIPLILASLSLVFLLGCTRVYVNEVVVPGHSFHGIHGLTFDSEDNLYVGSVIGQAIYKIDTETGANEIYIGPPEGMADDLEFAPDGTLVWTAFILGKIYARTGDGPIRELASGLPGLNSLAFKQDGRLFATQVFQGDALHEIDLEGKKKPRLIMEGMGGLNGFDFGPDGMLYGPLWFKGQVVRVDVDTAELTVVAEGFTIPAAVNFDSKGNLYVLDTGRGHYYRVDTESGEKTLIAEMPTTGDNIALDSEDRLYTTIIPENAVYEIDTETGRSREVIADALSIPTDIDLYEGPGGDLLYLADTFAIRSIDPHSGKVNDFARMFADEMEYSTAISVSDDRVVVAGFLDGFVGVYDRMSGEALRTYHDLRAPFDVLELSTGRLIVAQLMPGAIVLLPEDEHGETETVVRGLAGPVSLAEAEDGTVYVSESFGGRISSVDLQTGERTDIATGLKGVEGIAVAPDGRIVVAEVGLRRIVAIDPDSGEIEVIAEGLPIGLRPPEGMPPVYLVTGVTVARDGTIYYSSDLEDAVYRIRKKWVLK